MERTEASLIGQRSEAMAMVYLTSRPDIQAFRIDDRNDVDMFARIDRKGTSSAALFGVIVKGTAKALLTPKAANIYLSMPFKRFEKAPPLSMPLLILTFSMHDDAGYVTWLVEPSSRDDLPKLIIHSQPKNVPATKEALDEIVALVNNWSDRFHNLMFVNE